MKQSLRFSQSGSWWSHHPRRGRAVLLLLFTLGAVGAFRLTTAFRIAADDRQGRNLPRMPAPLQGQRVLVFAPHCDDEVLGAGGLMQQARRAGCRVDVVVLTNGDGFRIGAARTLHKLSPDSHDFEQYAMRRQGETRTALRLLGVGEGHVTFLGYPDRGLMPMWTDHWSRQVPFRSPYTLADHNPYADAPSPGTAYCGASLLADIKARMQSVQPTDIFVTHPDDEHPDHAAAGVFIQEALEQLRGEGASWARRARLHFYLVHHGDWPVPQGLYESAALPPPAALKGLDTRWESRPLSLRDTQRKYAAIKRYGSQIEVSSRFLYSFARRNELFGTLDEGHPLPLVCVPEGVVSLHAPARGWPPAARVTQASVGDNLVRAVQPGGSFLRLYACRTPRFLYVRADMRGQVAPNIRYAILLRPVIPGPGEPACLTLPLTPGREGVTHRVPGVLGASYAWRDRSIAVAVPLNLVGSMGHPLHTDLYVMAESKFAGAETDHTSFRAVQVP